MKNFTWRVLLAMLACAGVIAATFAVSSSSVAAGAPPANLVQNGSFESGYPGDNVCGSWWYGVGYGCDPSASTIPGWTVGGGGVDWHTTHGGGEPVAQDGSHLVDLNSTSGDTRGSISQSIATTAGAQYSLSFSYTAHSICAPNPSPMTVTAGSSSAVFTAPNPTQFTQSPWRLGSVAFTASASSTTIAFQSNLDDVCGGVLVDNVSVEQAVAPLVIQVPLTTIVEGPLGSAHALGSLDIPAALRGTVCGVGITGLNNESQREGKRSRLTFDYRVVDASQRRKRHESRRPHRRPDDVDGQAHIERHPRGVPGSRRVLGWRHSRRDMPRAFC